MLRLTAPAVEVLRSREIVSRPGGDEFLILAPVLSSGDALFDVATRVLSVFALPFNVETRPFCGCGRPSGSRSPTTRPTRRRC